MLLPHAKAPEICTVLEINVTSGEREAFKFSQGFQTSKGVTLQGVFLLGHCFVGSPAAMEGNFREGTRAQSLGGAVPKDDWT